MKFHLNHDPANKTLTIPRAALQLSGLADVSDLILHTDSGCVLLDPDLYLMVKTDARSITVGLWNFSLDAIEAPVVELAAPSTQLKTVNCTGSISGNRVTLSRLPAQEFCCFTAELAGNQEG